MMWACLVRFNCLSHGVQYCTGTAWTDYNTIPLTPLCYIIYASTIHKTRIHTAVPQPRLELITSWLLVKWPTCCATKPPYVVHTPSIAVILCTTPTTTIPAEPTTIVLQPLYMTISFAGIPSKPQPLYGPLSGTTRESRCQKRTSGLYGARRD